MTQDNHSNFSPTRVHTAALDSGKLVVTLNNAAHAIANQPQFPPITGVKGLQNVNTHLQNAKGHANNWLTKYSKDTLNTLQGVISFSETFNNLYGGLQSAATNMGTQTHFNKDQISSLIAQIQALQSLVSGQKTSADGVYQSISTYQTNVGTDASNFATDLQTANSELGGTKGAIAQLQKKINGENKALTKDALMIAGGAVGVVAGVLCIVAGVGLEIETAGVSTALVVAGIALVAGGATVTGIGGKNYDQTLKQMQKDQKQLANDEETLSLITHLSTGITGLSGQLSETQHALQTLVTSWQELDNGLGAVVTDLQNPEDYLKTVQKTQPNATPKTVATIVSAELKTANDDWLSTKSQASNLLAKLRAPQYLTSKDLPTQSNILATYKSSAARAAAA